MTGKVFYEELGFLYIELVKFDKEEVELQTDLERWFYVLKHMSRLDKLSVYLRKPIFEQLFSIAAYTQLNKEERDMYDVSLKRKWDAEAVREYQEQKLAATEQQALERGLQKGLEQGEKKGLQQGLLQRREEGSREKAIAIAKALQRTGLSVEDIAQATGLSISELKTLS
ncbi:PD-(D/E)XK nuclease family transposase [Sphingobacterium bambusae]|uniref:PD-(D/E)XK nuclease family transposase n=1 Tax=Sphingobacterium bambusae TaxID=662858 RepID=A0ABW6BBH9_9SPHI|nr:PD-(D/E)XK nuclease family transposase [Sphingobacterium bambusae]WPL51117.1 PD-(D/E)XK nuclease family transposase [Sphingobacterium bambusae]